MEHRRLDWDGPLLPQICRELLALASGTILDLSDRLVVVPTAQSGRRLREALAMAAGERGKGLLPPAFVTPERLLGDPPADTASEACALAAWAEVLGRINAAEYPQVFPKVPETETAWIFGMAVRLVRLQSALGEEGYDCAGVADAVAETACEPTRWRQLASLEGKFRKALARRGLHDPHAARFDAVTAPALPRGVRGIIFAAVADPMPLALRALETLEQSHEVAIWTYGPKDADAFDAYGRPDPDFWGKRPLELERMGALLHSPAAPEACAEIVVDAAGSGTPGSVDIGIADHALSAAVGKALAAAGLQSYDPAGIPLKQGGSGLLADLLCRLPAEPGTDTVRELFHHPDLWRWLKAELGECSQGGLLRMLDRICERHLPADLDGLAFFAARRDVDAPLAAALRQLQALRQSLDGKEAFGEALRDCLRGIYRVRTVDPGDEHDAAWIEKAEALSGALESAAATEAHFPELGKAFMRTAVRQAVAAAVTHPERPQAAHDLLGWLELLWTDAPDLVVAGLNEGVVPEAVKGDAFLPETLRTELGMRTNAARFARDAYLLAATCHWRSCSGGRIELIAPRAAADGTPHKPSRLLFLCDDESLLKRTRQLFGESETTAPAVHRGATWTYRPPPAPRISLSVSKLSAWLRCPFRFCLGHVLGMEPVEARRREMDPLLFGNLFHETVQILGGRRFEAETNAGALAEELEAELAKTMADRFGTKLSFALRLQKEALVARLRAFAEKQIDAIGLGGGFEIIGTEEELKLDLEGGTIKGRIDRVDRLADGSLRLIDYKTGDTAATPFKAHLKAVGKNGRAAFLPEAAFVEIDGKEYQWTDLQLPLYAEQKRRDQNEAARPAYFNLPKSRDQAGLVLFDELNRELIDSAVHCANAVAIQIRDGHFWPPNNELREAYDDFARLFPEGIEAAVEAADFAPFNYATEDPS